MLRKIFFCIFLFVYIIQLQAQWTSERCNKYLLKDTILLDSFTIIPESVTIQSYDFEVEGNQVLISGEKNSDSIAICYQVLPYNLSEKRYNRSVEDLDSAGIIFRNYSFEKKEEIFSTPGIDKSGVITRGISFGNNQDVFVNSNLNLQMSGNISNDVKLTATISDQNVPIQPEGNSQRLQEFDKIYIELEHNKWKINAGDIWLKNNQNAYFMKFSKRVQGGNIEVKTIQDSNYLATSHAGISLAKGKFYSQIIEAIEGVQGPYRLNGSNGEKFIIVIANSEKVFLDGKELKRGFNYDYVIDYNTGEITFNNTIFITKFSRIRVDFEYTERNYTRSVISTGHNQKIGENEFYYEYFVEKDHPRQPILTELTEQEKGILSIVGDSIQNAFISSAQYSDTFAQIKYKRLIVGTDTIYEYSTNLDSAKYIVTFSEVGEGNGDYIIDLTPVNGRIYKYVGKSQGNYLPVRLLPVPNKREMMVLGNRWSPSKNTSYFVELSMSTKDINLVSQSNDNDNKGLGIRVGRETKEKKINDSYSYSSNIEYQYTSETFNVLDRIREADFQRDWNENRNLISEDNIILTTVRLKGRAGKFIQLENNFRNKQNDVKGYQNKLIWDQSFGGFNIKGLGFVMDNFQNNYKAQWRKLSVNPNIDLGIVRPGYILNSEKNRLVDSKDSVVNTQMNFEEHNFYIENGDTGNTYFLMNYQLRKDFQPVAGELNWFDGLNSEKWNDKARTVKTEFKKEIGSAQFIGLTGTYRELETKVNAIFSDSTAFENNFLSRVDWNSNYFKRHITSEITYTVNTARELKREFQYVPWGNYATATHVWRDYDGDEIEDLDEFFPIINNETENTYIKFLVPTSEYLMAFTNTINYRLNIKAPTQWKKEKNIKSIISKFNNLTILNTERKTTDNNLNDRLNPFIGLLDTVDLSSTNVLSLRKSLRSTLFFNRTNPVYGFDLTKTNLSTKQLITNGNDARLQDGWLLNSRVNITKYISSNTALNLQKNINKSTYLTTRNYTIEEMGGTEKVSVQPNTNLRFTLLYSYTIKNGISILEDVAAETNKVGLETKVNQLSKRTITTSFNYIFIKYNGEQNTPMAYDIMNALQQGNNFTWQVNMQQRLSNGLNINFIYEGRKSGQNNVIHIGRVQVSALF